jgi:hypothetical protein
MDETPNIDEFQRHMQSLLEKTSNIVDSDEQQTRRLQIESAIQEALRFKHKWIELKKAGSNPLKIQETVRLIVSAETMKETIGELSSSKCLHCSASLQGDIEFCAVCGKFQK